MKPKLPRTMSVSPEILVLHGPGDGILAWQDKLGKICYCDIIPEKAAFHFRANKRHWYGPEELRFIADMLDECKDRGIHDLLSIGSTFPAGEL